MQVNQKTDPSSTNEFNIHDLRFTYTIHDSSITHTHILLIFKNICENLRKQSAKICEKQKERISEKQKEKHSARNTKE
ncbi:hypothetical protein BHF72_2079 [Cloacibacterium normanense]|uniref:Uncharacterized protein n=1 Tax=Cloacibacterium normanense TaxID=237258 RepID=A0A1E5UF56_9FLAO|nr:hypothetical protein BHF72_2079 [Cloacibacterium normanense]